MKNLLQRTVPVWALIAPLATHAAVPVEDVTLLPVISDNLPIVGATTSSSHNEASVTSNLNLAPPLLYPYVGQTNDRTWDEIISNQQQARLPVIKMITGGLGFHQANQDHGQNPYFLPKYIQALDRYGAANSVKFMCCPIGARTLYRLHYNLPNDNSWRVDFANEDSWEKVWWNYVFKPWFDAIPPRNLFLLKGGVPIEFWGLNSTTEYTNQQGNISRFFEYLSDQVEANYGVPATFIVCDSQTNYDTTLANYPRLIGLNPWFSNSGYQQGNSNGYMLGTVIPGFMRNGNTEITIPRNGPGGTGNNGDTLVAGFQDMLLKKSNFTGLEGWINPGEGTSFYRAATEVPNSNSLFWDVPNQYVNLTRRFTDPRTATLRLDAMACDQYSDTTAGNSPGAYRRGGNLDIRELPVSGWAVTNTAAGEWIQFNAIDFSKGTYKFSLSYSALTPRKVKLSVDGVSLGEVTIPGTGDMATFDTVSLGVKAIGQGARTIRLTFVDGGADVKWVFVKKSDPLMTFRSAVSNEYLTADMGGNARLYSDQPLAAAWEHFTICGTNGSGIVASGDPVSIQSHNGLYLSAGLGGGGEMTVDRRDPRGWETFQITKVSGSGALAAGDQVFLKTNDGLHYVTLNPEGVISATGTTVGAAQKFTLGLTQLGAVPERPSNLQASSVNGSQVNLTWTDSANNETAYLVERSPDGVGFETIAMLPPNTQSYSDSGLPGYSSYHYRVRASNGTANSDYAPGIVATTLAGIPARPQGVVGASAPAFGAGSVRLNWNTVNGATNYEVYRSTTPGGGYAILGTSTTGAYLDATVTLGATYYYSIVATNSYGSGNGSAGVRVVPKGLLQATIGTGTGSASYNAGSFTLNGSGGDITGAADRCHFAYTPVTGDFRIQARLDSLTGNNGWTKGGLMVRETLAADSRYGIMTLTRDNGTNIQVRREPGAVDVILTRIAGLAAPRWLAVERKGNTLQFFHSPDGINWTLKADQTTMGATVYVGLVQTHAGTSSSSQVTISQP